MARLACRSTCNTSSQTLCSRDFLLRLSDLEEYYLRLRGRLEAAAGLSTPIEWGRRCLLILMFSASFSFSFLEELACAEAVYDPRVCSQEASPRARTSTFTSRAFGRSTSRPSNRMHASQSPMPVSSLVVVLPALAAFGSSLPFKM